MRRRSPLTGLDRFMAKQRLRLEQKWAQDEARLKERLKDIGQDRTSRLAITLNDDTPEIPDA